jgi:hypothetical protein
MLDNSITITSGDFSSPNFYKKKDSNLSQETIVWGCCEIYHLEAFPLKV